MHIHRLPPFLLGIFLLLSLNVQAEEFRHDIYYKIINKHSQKSLDVNVASKEKGANVIQWSYWEGEHQQWKLLENGDGTYRIVTRHSNQVLDVAGLSTADNANVLQWPWKSGNTANQRWKVIDLGNGHFSFINLHSGRALQVMHGSGNNGANIVQGTYRGLNEQQWRIEPAYPDGPNAGQEQFKIAGFATLNGGTDGGYGGRTVTVSNLSDFKKYAQSNSPNIIRVNGIIRLTGMVKINSDKTILGLGNNSGFTGGGLEINSVRNVIVRNLKLSYSRDDLIKVQSSSNVWIDHNELWNDRHHGKDYYDGLIDITRGSDYVTVSWNKLHDHHKGNLIGHSDNNSGEDFARLRVTYRHNLFANVDSRIPSIRFGQAHFYNNYVLNADFAINSRMGAEVLVEGNHFESVKLPIATDRYSQQDGYAIERYNLYVNSGTNRITQTGSFHVPPYPYELEDARSVAETVMQNAGVGIIAH
ncbi:RICIN domain-containing protein [Hahella ganghwensis]|uniref:pectate lyase family protein n=1 Tax=Hahella ganghwensis TaxID=286420 RepID=UPI0003643D6E|nr:RICIN domain-containing protein [Hahella ganghwensis]